MPGLAQEPGGQPGLVQRGQGEDGGLSAMPVEGKAVIYPITPCPKPRQTRADKWKKRPPVMRYRAFADECRVRQVVLPEEGAHVTFHVPMPASWSKKKRAQMQGAPHRSKPDADNLFKALADALYGDDSGIWDARITKRWAEQGAIEIL